MSTKVASLYDIFKYGQAVAVTHHLFDQTRGDDGTRNGQNFPASYQFSHIYRYDNDDHTFQYPGYNSYLSHSDIVIHADKARLTPEHQIRAGDFLSPFYRGSDTTNPDAFFDSNKIQVAKKEVNLDKFKIYWDVWKAGIQDDAAGDTQAIKVKNKYTDEKGQEYTPRGFQIGGQIYWPLAGDDKINNKYWEMRGLLNRFPIAFRIDGWPRRQYMPDNNHIDYDQNIGLANNPQAINNQPLIANYGTDPNKVCTIDNPGPHGNDSFKCPLSAHDLRTDLGLWYAVYSPNRTDRPRKIIEMWGGQWNQLPNENLNYKFDLDVSADIDIITNGQFEFYDDRILTDKNTDSVVQIELGKVDFPKSNINGQSITGDDGNKYFDSDGEAMSDEDVNDQFHSFALITDPGMRAQKTSYGFTVVPGKSYEETIEDNFSHEMTFNSSSQYSDQRKNSESSSDTDKTGGSGTFEAGVTLTKSAEVGLGGFKGKAEATASKKISASVFHEATRLFQQSSEYTVGRTTTNETRETSKSEKKQSVKVNFNFTEMLQPVIYHDGEQERTYQIKPSSQYRFDWIVTGGTIQLPNLKGTYALRGFPGTTSISGKEIPNTSLKEAIKWAKKANYEGVFNLEHDPFMISKNNHDFNVAVDNHISIKTPERLTTAVSLHMVEDDQINKDNPIRNVSPSKRALKYDNKVDGDGYGEIYEQDQQSKSEKRHSPGDGDDFTMHKSDIYYKDNSGTKLDILNFGSGDDFVISNGAEDIINLGPGHDFLKTTSRQEFVTANADKGNDVFVNRSNLGSYQGGKGDDTLIAISGDNFFTGGSGSDTLELKEKKRIYAVFNDFNPFEDKVKYKDNFVSTYDPILGIINLQNGEIDINLVLGKEDGQDEHNSDIFWTNFALLNLNRFQSLQAEPLFIRVQDYVLETVLDEIPEAARARYIDRQLFGDMNDFMNVKDFQSLFLRKNNSEINNWIKSLTRSIYYNEPVILEEDNLKQIASDAISWAYDNSEGILPTDVARQLYMIAGEFL